MRNVPSRSMPASLTSRCWRSSSCVRIRSSCRSSICFRRPITCTVNVSPSTLATVSRSCTSLADARDALLEHAFDARGQRVPVERRAGDPASVVVLHEIAPFMHVAQQLGREQRVPAGSIVQLATKLGVEPVGFGVDQCVDELLGFAGRLVVQRDGHVAVLALDLRHDLGQRVSRFVARVRQFLAAIRADDQDVALLDAASEVEQQAGRRFVDPVHVVEDQHQRPLARHLQQDGRNLLEDAALFGHRRRRGSRGIRDARWQRPGPAPERAVSSGNHRAGLGDQPGTRDQQVHQVGRELGDDLLRDAQEVTEPLRVLLRREAVRNALVDLARQHAEQFAEGQVRITDARLGIARADGDQQLLLLLLRASRELERQAGLAEPGFAGDEADPAATLQGVRQEPAQLAEFLFARDEDRFHLALSGACAKVSVTALDRGVNGPSRHRSASSSLQTKPTRPRRNCRSTVPLSQCKKGRPAARSRKSTTDAPFRHNHAIARGHENMTNSPTRLVSALAIALLLVACGSRISQDNFNRIADGMAYADVVKILGQPKSSESRGALGITAGTAKWNDGAHQISIVFVNDKVTSKVFREVQETPKK